MVHLLSEPQTHLGSATRDSIASYRSFPPVTPITKPPESPHPICAFTAIDPANFHSSFCALEQQIENANVDMTSSGVIVLPGTRKTLRSTPSSPGGSITTWATFIFTRSSRWASKCRYR